LIHFHDLRHTGNNLAADAGAGLRELMERMGHSTTRAALTYLHASDQRQRVIAEALSKINNSELKRRGSARSGTKAARRSVKIIGACGDTWSDLRRRVSARRDSNAGPTL
jgi:hypothetical protein